MNSSQIDLSKLKIDHDDSPGESGGAGKKIIGGVIVLAILGSLTFFLWPMLKPAKKVELVTVAMTSAAQANSVLTASGYIVPQRKAAVASKATGQLMALEAEEGDRVTKDQIIARLDNRDVLARFNQMEANLALANAQLKQEEAMLEQLRREYERKKSLHTAETLSDAEFDIAEAQWLASTARRDAAKAGIEATRAAVQAARVDLDNTIIRAPFDGTVLTKNADIGEMVAPFAGSANSRGAVVTIADMASLQLEADVSESNLERIKVDQPCEIVLDAFPEKRYRGVVWKIVPTVNRAKATVLTKVKILDIDDRILPDMSAKVNFLSDAMTDSLIQTRPKITLPQTAILNSRIFLLNDETIQVITVVIGETMGDRVVILGGLSAGDQVVNHPTAELRDGDKVQAQ